MSISNWGTLATASGVVTTDPGGEDSSPSSGEDSLSLSLFLSLTLSLFLSLSLPSPLLPFPDAHTHRGQIAAAQ